MTTFTVPYSLRSHRLCVPKVPLRLQDGLVPRSRVNRCGQTTEKKHARTYTQNNDFIGRRRKINVLRVRHAVNYVTHVQTKNDQTTEKRKKNANTQNFDIIGWKTKISVQHAFEHITHEQTNTSRLRKKKDTIRLAGCFSTYLTCKPVGSEYRKKKTKKTKL